MYSLEFFSKVYLSDISSNDIFEKKDGDFNK